MATFKVGQRVKVVSAYWAHELIGLEGVIAPDWDSPPPPGWHNVTLGVPNAGGYDSWARPGWQFASHHLAPLTDPKADAFIERIKRLANEPQPMKREVV